MLNIILIGAGELGSRHLQGLVKVNHMLNIWVTDPSSESLARAEERLEEIEYDKKRIKIFFSNSLVTLDEPIFLCIVATSSKVRMGVIIEVTEKHSIKYMLLEKFLFQKEKEYNICKNLLSEKNIDCWVNCTRRMFPVYNQIKDSLAVNEKIMLTVIGGSWGLGSNSIHFLDLFNFLSGKDDDLEGIANITDVNKSKRLGYIELEGTFNFRKSNGSELLLHSRFNSGNSLQMQIMSDDFLWRIDENNKIVEKFIKGQKVSEESFELPFQSSLTNLVCEKLISDGQIDLPTYESSMKGHKKLLEIFNKELPLHRIQVKEGCPIT